MSFSDPLGDMLTRIRNAIMRNRSSVTTPAFHVCLNLAAVFIRL